MEVHHHSHAEGKRLKHYLFEFFMLFFAVFCGFLAENQREHIVERQREKQYMSTMLEDLKSDTAFLNFTINHLNIVNISIDSVNDAIRLPIINTDFITIYRHLNKALDFWSFRYNDRTISQLKNSGNFRLIRNREIANKIISYDRFNSNEMVSIEKQRNNFFEKVIDIGNRLFDQQILYTMRSRFNSRTIPVSKIAVLDSMLRKSKIPLSPESQAALLFEFKNALLTYRSNYTDLSWGYNNIGQSATELMSL